MTYWNHIHSLPSGALFGIAFGIAFGFSLEVMSYRKHSNLYYHYEKNLHYFKNNLIKDIHNRFAQLYFDTKSENEELKRQVYQIQKELDQVIQAFHEYLEINVIHHKSRSNSRSYSFDSHVSNLTEKNDQFSPI
jgi:hypothetical protein